MGVVGGGEAANDKLPRVEPRVKRGAEKLKSD